jgi:hypothetical protein
MVSMTIAQAGGALGLCLMLSVPALGQEKPRQDNKTSCRQFVTAFYKWYLEASLKQDPLLSAADRAVKNRPYLFSSELVQRLREASEVQQRTGSDLVGLDIDPFSGPDGSGDQFVVEKVTIKDDRCWAEIHFVWNGKKNAAPDVTPELSADGHRWTFLNFYYPSPDDPKASNLLSDLKAARVSWKASGLLKDKKH